MNKKQGIFAVISYPFLPATTGGEISTKNILNYLGKVHNLTVFTVEPYNQDFKKEILNFELIFGMKFKFWRYFNFFLVFKILSLIKKHNSNIIFFDQPWFGWMIPVLKLFSSKKVFIRSNNIEYLRFKSINSPWWPVLYMYEKFTYLMSDLVIFVSEVDQKKAINEFDLKVDKTMLTPYGIESEVAPQKKINARLILEETHQIKQSEKVLLFFATMSYQPNYEAVKFIADEIYPLLKQKEFDFKILICGKNLPQSVQNKLEGKDELIYCGFVDDIETYIDGSDLMINPILSGGGVKTKAIDTLARNQKVISTKTGAEGINPAVCGSNLLIIDDYNWEEFCNAIISSLNTKANLPNSFYEVYSWPKIIEKLSIRLDKL